MANPTGLPLENSLHLVVDMLTHWVDTTRTEQIVQGNKLGQSIMTSLTRTSSWVIVNRATGAALFETFQESITLKLNTAKYQAVPVLQYLQQFNRSIKA